MKLLITGGNGFLGKHVVNALKKTNIEFLTPTSSELDILKFDDLSLYVKNNNITCILHMAAKCAGILGNRINPADFLRDNTQMGLNVYEAARINKVKNVYSLGSVCAYPKYCPTPFKEDDLWNGYPEETNAPYGQAKRTLMMLGQTYRKQYDIGGAHLIPVNMYGEYDSFDETYSHVIPALIKKFHDATQSGSKIVKCWGTGDGATREFLYAGDCANAITKAISNNLNTDFPINIGVGKDISIRNLANLIGGIMNYTGEIIFTGEVSDGQPVRKLDVSRSFQLLNWRSETKLIDGLKITIDWYVKNTQ